MAGTGLAQRRSLAHDPGRAEHRQNSFKVCRMRQTTEECIEALGGSPRQAGQWRIVFHQGTPCAREGKVEL